jgi:hypothetical protein
MLQVLKHVSLARKTGSTFRCRIPPSPRDALDRIEEAPVMDEHTRAPERDQSQSREPANAPDERPRFQTNDPATGQSGRAYEGHTRE